MKSFFNIFRGFIAAIFFIVYWIFLLISFILLPISIIFKDSNSLNKLIDNTKIEIQLINYLTYMPTDFAENSETLENIDYSEVFSRDIIDKIVNERRSIINSFYLAIENKEAMYYEIDLDFYLDLYADVLTNQITSMPVCDTWVTAEESNTGTLKCLPPMYAIANDIEVPDTVVVPPDFVITDDMKIENIRESLTQPTTGEEIQTPVIQIDAATASDLNIIQMLMKVYIYVFIGVTLIIFLLYLLISPARKAAVIALSIMSILTSIVGAILWKIPKIYVAILLSSSGATGTEAEYVNILTDIITSVLNAISKKGLLMTLWVGIISILAIVLAIILGKKKNANTTEETKTTRELAKKEQPTGKNNSTK